MKSLLLAQLLSRLNSGIIDDRSSAVLCCGVLLERVAFAGGDRNTQHDILGPDLCSVELDVGDTNLIIRELGKALRSTDFPEDEKGRIVWALGKALQREAVELVCQYLETERNVSEETCYQAAIAVDNLLSTGVLHDREKYKKVLADKTLSPRVVEILESWQ